MKFALSGIFAYPLIGRMVEDRQNFRTRKGFTLHASHLPTSGKAGIYASLFSLSMGRKRGAHEHKCLASSAMNKLVGFSALAGVLFLAGCIRFHPRPLSPANTADNLENRSLSDPSLRKYLENNLHRELT